MLAIECIYLRIHVVSIVFTSTHSQDANVLPRTVSLFTKLLPPNSEATPIDTSLLKVALQLLGNACAGYPEGQERVWQLCFPQDFRYIHL